MDVLRSVYVFPFFLVYDVDRHCVLLFKMVLVRWYCMHLREGLVISVPAPTPASHIICRSALRDFIKAISEWRYRIRNMIPFFYHNEN